jgi:hypothetical protein
MDQQLSKPEKKPNMLASLKECSWGTEDLDASDIIIPRLLLMQAMSEFVQNKKAQSGDFVNSVTMERLGGVDAPLELILVDSFKNWIISEKGPKEGKFKFKEVFAWKDGNPDWKFEEVENGITTRRYKCLNFYVLPTGSLDGFPLLLSFRSSSYQAGRKLVNFATEAKMYRKPMAYKTVKLGAMQVTNDMGTFNVFTVEPGRLSKDLEVEQAFKWYNTIRQKSVATHEEESDIPF